MSAASQSAPPVHHIPILDEPTIYIYGDTLEGQLIAHSLKRLSKPPNVNLLFATVENRDRWNKDRRITVSLNDYVETTRDFVAELGRPPFKRHGRIVTRDVLNEPVVNPHWETKEPGPLTQDDPPVPDFDNKIPIKYLILAIPPHSVVPRLQAIMHRLSADSTILLIHQGLGVLERIAVECWPDAAKRPNLIQGFSTHRLYKNTQTNSNFMVNWSDQGSITVAPLPRFQKTLFEADAFAAMEEKPAPSDAEYLINTLKKCGSLLMNDTSVTDLFLAQLEAVVIESIIQPLSALLDVRNGQILYSYHFTSSIRLLLTELSLVVRSLPELQSYPNLETRFAPERLETLIVAQLYRTSMDWTPMATDVRAGRAVGIDYFPGYIIKRGEELGMKCWMNFTIMHLVKGKTLTIRHENNAQVPV